MGTASLDYGSTSSVRFRDFGLDRSPSQGQFGGYLDGVRHSVPALPSDPIGSSRFSRLQLAPLCTPHCPFKSTDDDDDLLPGPLLRNGSSRASLGLGRRTSRESEATASGYGGSRKLTTPATDPLHRKTSLQEQRQPPKLDKDVLGTTLGLGTGRVEYKRADPLAKYFEKERKPPPAPRDEPKDPMEYAQRLMAAHSLVDDLLKGRGLTAEDERKYLKSWEEMPIVREIRRRSLDRRLRRMSTDSSDDSGVAAEEEAPDAHAAFSQRLVRLDDEVSIVERFGKPVVERVEFSCLAPAPPEPVEIDCAHRFKKTGAKSAVTAIRTTRGYQAQKVHARFIIAPNVPPKNLQAPVATTEVSMIKKTPENQGAAAHLSRRVTGAQTIALSRVGRAESCNQEEEDEPLTAKELAKLQLRRAAKRLDSPSSISQRDILARLEPHPQPIKSSAEISIQHCSYYQMQERLQVVEKNVRINLRLTERAPSHQKTRICLRAPPKFACVRLDLKLPDRPEPMRRNSTQALHIKPRDRRRLDRAATVAIGVEYLAQQRPIRRLQIPELFRDKPEFAAARERLRKTAEPRPTPPRRRPPEPPKIVHQLVERAEERRVAEQATISGNDDSTAERHATTTVSAGKAVIARRATWGEDMSETDRRLIEKLRWERCPVPRPHPVRHLSLLVPPRIFEPKQMHLMPMTARFIRRKTPEPKREVKKHGEKCRSPMPGQKRFLTVPRGAPQRRSAKTDFGVVLKKARAVPRIGVVAGGRRTWVPRWRRGVKSSDKSEEEVKSESEEEEEEEEQSVIESLPVAAPKSPAKPVEKVEEPKEMSEAEAAMLAAKRRQEDEKVAQIQDYEQRRKIDKVREQEELKALKEKCERRRAERREEEEAYNEQRRTVEEAHRRQEEEKKAAMEVERKRREEERRRKQQSMAGGGFLGIDLLEPDAEVTAKRNFVIPPKSKRRASTLGIAGKKEAIGEEERERARKNYLANVLRPIDPSTLLANDLKVHIKQIHARIVRLEAEKYDLELRNERQEYDLKELAERQKQQTRNKALRMGIDPDEDDLTHPPKLNVASKHDRQTDHRSYGDRRVIFELPKRYQAPKIARGTGRPPAEWGRKSNEELDCLRKHVEGAAHNRYVEQNKVETGPVLEPIPLQLPEDQEA
ncbi:unnamed protein product, partial [Mesorhabditis spiculigera]